MPVDPLAQWREEPDRLDARRFVAQLVAKVLVLAVDQGTDYRIVIVARLLRQCEEAGEGQSLLDFNLLSFIQDGDFFHE